MNDSRLIKILTALSVVIVMSIVAVVLSPSNSGALTSRAQAETEINRICRSGGRVGHAAYMTNISDFNPSTNSVAYDLNILWRRCNDSNSTSTGAYAITGYPANGLAVCPNVGTYGNGPNGQTNDCVKYIGNTPWSPGVRNGIECRGGRNDDCVNANFNRQWDNNETIRRQADQPPTDLRRIQMRRPGSGSGVPNFNTSTSANSGTYNLGSEDNICSYYKLPSDWTQDVGRRHCQSLRLPVSWQVWGLVPTIATPAAPNNRIVKGQEFNAATMQVRNARQANSPEGRWIVGRMVIPASQSPRGDEYTRPGPNSYFGGQGGWRQLDVQRRVFQGNQTVSNLYSNGLTADETSNLNAGDKVCWTLSVENPWPTWIENVDTWRHTTKCVTVVGAPPPILSYPKLQVRGNDVRARGDIVMSQTLSVDENVFGSWGEFGVMSSGLNTNMASQAGLRKDGIGDQSNWSELTFANENSSYGSWEGLPSILPNIKSHFVNGGPSKLERRSAPASMNLPATASAVYSTTGDVTISGADTAIGSGRTIVVMARNVTIQQNVRYEQGPYNNISELPQVLIFASGTININNNVTNVDAWLLSDGAVNTCADVVPNVNRPVLSKSRCSEQLRVNGPVSTKELYAFRTAGAREGSESEPAEIFNLRPDAYLWAYHHGSQLGRPVTTSVTELPPRF